MFINKITFLMLLLLFLLPVVVFNFIQTNHFTCSWMTARWSATTLHCVRSTSARRMTMDICTWSMHHRTHSA